MTNAMPLEIVAGPGKPTHPDQTTRQAEVDEVVALLSMDKNGAPHGTPQNLEVILTRDPWFRSRLRWNQFSEVIEWEGERIVDEHITFIRLAIGRTYRRTWGAPATLELVAYVARKLAYHPVKSYLKRLVWDGVPRLDMLLPKYVGAEDTELHRVMGRRFMIASIARIMKPPCKVDTVLTLFGGQGAGKSTFFRVLCGDSWFRDTPFDIRNKDSYQLMRGAWLYEVAEMASIRQRDVETVKAFFAAEVDHFRPPYGKVVRESVRQCVFVSTTNEPSFLKDPTGARRFWPVKVGTIDLSSLKADRDALWAEALAAFVAGEAWWLTREQDEDLAVAQEPYQHEDPWEDPIREWMTQTPQDIRGNGVRVSTLLRDALDIEKGKLSKYDEMRIAALLTMKGWRKDRVRVDGSRKKEVRWFPPVEEKAEKTE